MRLDRRQMILGLGGWLVAGRPRAAAADGEEGVDFIGADEVRRVQQSPPRRLLLVDVRSSEEFQDARIAGAVNVPLGEIERRLGEIPRQGLVVLY
jgi:hypothetical protein